MVRRAVRGFNARMKRTEQATEAPLIHPQAVYSLSHLRSLLGLAASTLKAERRAGRLRVGRRGNRYFCLGVWVLEWLEAGELPLRRPAKRVGSSSPNGEIDHAKEGKS